MGHALLETHEVDFCFSVFALLQCVSKTCGKQTQKKKKKSYVGFEELNADIHTFDL